MGLFELFLIAVGLSMDAFAVSICKGLSMNRGRIGKALTIGLYFGFFQAFMPFLGYLLGAQFADKINAYDHWIAFVLLVMIGGKMVKDSFAEESGEQSDDEESTTFKEMFPLAIATSIDALAIGISFAFLKVNIIPAVSVIGITTLVLSMVGVKIGSIFGVRFKTRAELVGGIILILMGTKILLEHFGILTAQFYS